MAYNYDIFLSYMHDEQMGAWVHDHFSPFLRSFVGNALNRPLKLFVDREGIQSGDSWPIRLQEALGKSRCMIAVWSPLYFHSPWCRKECAVMLSRERDAGCRTINNPKGLIIPTNVFDGNFFPDKAREIEWFDLRDYWIVGRGFEKTEKYVEFQDRVRNWSPQIAQSVLRAPAWRKKWLSDECFNVSDSELCPKPAENFEFVGLE